MKNTRSTILSQRAILFFWLPLAFSWLMMTFEGPWIQGVISRKPDPERQLAAFGLVFSLSVLIESPVIMLLATSSALSRDRQAYRVLWRFMMMLNVGVTVIAILMAFTPLLDVYLGNILNIPPDIIEAARPGMMIMVLWSALIGFRRFQQGILINHGHTAQVGRGSVVRIVASGGVALLLGLLTDLPGAVIGAGALISAVAVEAFYIYTTARTDIQDVMATDPPSGKVPMRYRDAANFHFPLALTSIMTLLVRPVIERGLAGTPNAELALAAWPVIYSIVLLARAGGMAWQEVVISLNHGPDALQALRRFTWRLGFGLSGLLILMAFTPVITVYIGTILEVPASLHTLVITGTQVAIAIPLLTTLQSYLRAVLMRSGTTSPIYQAMLLGFVATAVSMGVGLALQGDGIQVASIAMTVGLIVEMAYLWRASVLYAGRLQLAWQQ